MSKLLPEKLEQYFFRYLGDWTVFIKVEPHPLSIAFYISPNMVLYFSHIPLVHLDSAEDLQAFLTGIKGKMVNEHGEVAVSDLTDAMSEDDFVKLICEITEVDPIRLKTDTHYRGGMYPLARQLHMIVRRQAFKMSLRRSGEVYGKDHTTVLFAIRTVTGTRQVDPAFRRLTDPIFSEIDAIISGSRRTM